MQMDWVNALIGGVLIGISVSFMLLWTGRVVGISGIVNGVISPATGETSWRVYFLSGLVLGGFVLRLLKPESFLTTLESGVLTVVFAGLLVGFGTVLGSGCTSGHGVCGISRMSVRSMMATIVFIVAGILSVVVFQKMELYG